ncbi:MAG: diphosphomevalonate decarboxylase [Candidatus Heimdallarchaeota archaeon]
MKASAQAHSNTALIKYWGKSDEKSRTPMNNSISITCDALFTQTTVEFSDTFSEDSFYLNRKKQDGKPYDRVIAHLDMLRKIAGSEIKAKVISENNFPEASGLASSASGFAALTLAACTALGLKKDKRELSILSRIGSGSSCRSMFGGYVEWIKNDKNNESYAKQLADENWFDIRDIALVFEKHERKYNTTDAMKISKETSPFYNARIEKVEEPLTKIRKAIKNKEFNAIGQIAEQDSLSMHAVAITSNPPLIFWRSETIKMMDYIHDLRKKGIDVYFTIDTGANMHLLTTPKFVDEIESLLRKIPYIKQMIVSKPGPGAFLLDEHLASPE